MQHGHQVANAVWQWSTSDGYELANDCAYTPPVGAGLWVRTPPGFDGAVQPCWGSIRPMVMAASNACDPGFHPEYSVDPASEFHLQALEVFDVGNNLTQAQRTIALYWADLAGESPTPAGHSLSIGTQVIEMVDGSLALAAEALARVGIAEMDAFISAWAAKYKYNLLRPITYINAHIDPAWTATLDTPPFPAYTSGHSNDVGASSTVMTAMFGGGFAFTDHTLDNKGFAPRSYGSFFEAADESAISRLYGGIHYRFDIEEGVSQGACVGAQVNALPFHRGLVSD
jgi:membrane-associated phospholipid phosphatase